MSRLLLAAAGFLLLLTGFLSAIFFVFLLRRVRENKRKARRAVRAREALQAARARYEKKYREFCGGEQPAAATLTEASLPGSANELRLHCLVKEGALAFLPVWGHFAKTEQDKPAAPDSIFYIPVANILCYALEGMLPLKFVALQYERGGEIVTLLFKADAAAAFDRLIPEKEFSHVLASQYPKSPRNIEDVKKTFLLLKELKQGAKISKEEYDEKKREIMIHM